MSGFENYTLSQVYREGMAMLKAADVEDADFNSLYLLEHFFSVDRTGLIIHGDKAADAKLCERFFSAVEERKSGKPLQYIVGKWNFMGLDFYVGEGVLIPRDDTEIVVEVAFDFLKNTDSPKVIDLCSGSGAIAVAIAKQYPNGSVTAMELSDIAVDYLNKNIELNNVSNVTVLHGDVTRMYKMFADETFDLVISNPPYIESDEIDTLQKELRFEPRMALDGGADGLYFYRIITEKWSSKVKRGGMLAYEVGEEQFEPVGKMLESKGFYNIAFERDLQNFKRTVSGIRY